MPERYYSQQYHSLIDYPQAAPSSTTLDTQNTGYDHPMYDRADRPTYDRQQSAQSTTSTAYEPYKPRDRSVDTVDRQQSTAYDRQPSEHPLNSYAGAGTSAGVPRTGPRTFDDHADLPKRPMQEKRPWSRKRKIIIFGSIALLLIIIAVAVGVGVTLSKKKAFSYIPSNAQVNSTEAFKSSAAGATHADPSNVKDGIGAGKDEYTYYSGPSYNFPNSTSWVSFEDMWSANLPTLQTSCKNLGYKTNNNDQQIQQIYDAIQNRSAVSLVDHRFIFAIILQESHGCVYVESTTSQSGVKNPGLMQTHNGHDYNSAHSAESILAMVQDGTQGTYATAGNGTTGNGATGGGEGLVQNLNYYTTLYGAARGYNSGYIPNSGDLSEAGGATACYVTDVANRLTGWVNAESKCPS